MGNWIYTTYIQNKKGSRPSAPNHIYVVTKKKKIIEKDSNQIQNMLLQKKKDGFEPWSHCSEQLVKEITNCVI